jgi:hypothetical protein
MKTIIEMAREAGIIHPEMVDKTLEAFAAIVLASADPQSSMAWQEGNEAGRLAEREACAKVCEEECADPDDQFKNYEDTHTDGWQDGCNSCAEAIRARGQV